MSKAIKVAFVEDHEQFRGKLAELTSGAPGFELAGTYKDGPSALAGIPLVKPDAVLLLLPMKLMNWPGKQQWPLRILRRRFRTFNLPLARRLVGSTRFLV